jgi:hypothetical protein
MIRLAVIEQKFLARFDVPQGEEEDVVVNDFAVAVGFAGMIDELRAVAAAAAVNRPIRIDAADIDAPFVLQAARDFVPANSFAGILGYLAPPFKSDGGETASAVNSGRPDFDSRGEACLFCPASAQSTDNGR